jgi:hypothetical protein
MKGLAEANEPKEPEANDQMKIYLKLKFFIMAVDNASTSRSLTIDPTFFESEGKRKNKKSMHFLEQTSIWN